MEKNDFNVYDFVRLNDLIKWKFSSRQIEIIKQSLFRYYYFTRNLISQFNGIVEDDISNDIKDCLFLFGGKIDD